MHFFGVLLICNLRQPSVRMTPPLPPDLCRYYTMPVISLAGIRSPVLMGELTTAFSPCNLLFFESPLSTLIAASASSGRTL